MTDLPLINPDLGSFHDAWHWLNDHPMFFFRPADDPKEQYSYESGFREGLWITVVRVDPNTDRIEDDPARNTATRVWLETGPYEPAEGSEALKFTGQHCHDIRLDCGAATYEDAIKELARLVKEHYGDYPEWHLCSHCLRRRPAGPQEENVSWFCSAECSSHGDRGIRVRSVPGKASVEYIAPHRYCPCSYHGAQPHTCDVDTSGECSVCGRE